MPLNIKLIAQIVRKAPNMCHKFDAFLTIYINSIFRPILYRFYCTTLCARVLSLVVLDFSIKKIKILEIIMITNTRTTTMAHIILSAPSMLKLLIS